MTWHPMTSREILNEIIEADDDEVVALLFPTTRTGERALEQMQRDVGIALTRGQKTHRTKVLSACNESTFDAVRGLRLRLLVVDDDVRPSERVRDGLAPRAARVCRWSAASQLSEIEGTRYSAVKRNST